LRDDTESILEEGNDDEESANSGEITVERRSASIEELLPASMSSWETHGLIGSLKVSRRSSTLLVYGRIWSRIPPFCSSEELPP
jgi:hypothetical protein